MIEFNNCLRCGSENIDKLKVNARINMNYPEQSAFGVISQRVIEATDALVCKDCGHIEFFIDWKNK